MWENADFLDDLFDYSRPKNNKIKDLHLQQAIRPWLPLAVVNNTTHYLGHKIGFNPLKSFSPFESIIKYHSNEISFWSIDHSRLFKIITNITRNCTTPEAIQQLLKSCNEAGNIINDLTKGSINSIFPSMHIESKFRKVDFGDCPLLGKYFTTQYKLNQLVTLTASRHKTKWNDPCLNYVMKGEGYFVLTLGSLDIYSDSNFTVIIYSKGKSGFILTREQLCLLSDIYTSRFNLLLFSFISRELYERQNVLSIIQLLELMNYGDNVLYYEGNNGYNLLSKFEPFCALLLLKLIPSKFSRPALFEQNLNEEVSEMNLTPLVLRKQGEMINRLWDWGGLNPSLITESAGLFRIWGNPVIDTLAGLQEIKKIATMRRPLHYGWIKRVESRYKYEFCTRYKAKYSVWPPLDVSALPLTSYLRKTIEAKEDLNIFNSEYNFLEWSLILAKKMFNVPEYMDLAEVLDDKSLSPPYSTVVKNINTKGIIGTAEEKSLIMSFLKENLVNCSEFLTRMDQFGWSPESKLVGLCPKELELKVNGRFFALLPLEKRLIVVLTESLIAEHHMSLFPESTMLDSETKLKKKFLDATREEDNVKKIVVSVDFSKWNLYMRKEETYGIFKFMDNSFGFNNLISRTHDMFSDSIIFLADGSLIPLTVGDDMVESEIAWRNHIGGLEGMRQKGWTLFSICVFLELFSAHPDVPFKIMGCGDNQYLIFYYDLKKFTESDILRKHSEIMRALTSDLKYIGPPIKMDETWTSDKYFSYGKFPILEGCPLTTSMKKIARTFNASNQPIVDIETALSSLSANMTASVAASYTPIPLVYIYPYLTFFCLRFHMYDPPFQEESIFENLFNNNVWLKKKTGDEKTKKIMASYRVPVSKGENMEVKGIVNQDFFRIVRDPKSHVKHLVPTTYFWLSLILTPPSYGGTPVMLPLSFLSRGFPDPNTLDTSILKLYHNQTSNGVIKKLIKSILSPKYNITQNYKMLFKDPTSFNLLHPSSQRDIIKRTSSNYLKDLARSATIQNTQFLFFISLLDDEDASLYETLTKFRPFHPRVLSEIVESTPTGQVENFLNKISNMGVLLKHFLSNKCEPKDVSRIQRSSANLISYIIISSSSTGDINWNEETCSTSHCEMIRAESWKIFPVEQWQGVTVASPLEFMRAFVTNGKPCTSQLHQGTPGYILVSPSFNLLDGIPNISFPKLGVSNPYTGSRVRDKINKDIKKFINLTPRFLKSALSLLASMNWISSEESQMQLLVETIISRYTDVNFRSLITSESSVSGTASHRFQDKFTKKGGIWPLLYNLATNFHLSTNLLTSYSKGEGNFNIFFQTLIMYGLIIEIIFYEENIDLTSQSIHLHEVCNCMRKINEDQIQIESQESPNWDMLVSKIPKDSYLWFSKDKISAEDDYSKTLYNATKDISFLDQETKLEILNQSIAAFVNDQVHNNSLFSHIPRGDVKSLNISWIYKMDLIHVLKHWSFLLVAKYLFNVKLHNQLKPEFLIPRFVEMVKDFNPSVGDLFSSITENQPLIDYLANFNEYGHIGFPLSGQSNTSSSVSTLIKNILVATIRYWLSGKKPQLGFSGDYYSFVSGKVYTHPCWLMITQAFLVSLGMNDDLLKKANDVKAKLQELPVENSILIDIVKLDDTQLSKNTKLLPSTRDYLKQFTFNVISMHPDTLAEYVNRKSYTISNKNVSFTFDTDFLSLSSELLSHHNSIKHTGSSLKFNYSNVPNQQFLYFKEYSNNLEWIPPRVSFGVSSAPAKLCTVVNLNKYSYQKILTLADGGGGYGAMFIADVWSRKIWYNSILHEKGIIPHVATGVPSYYHGNLKAQSCIINKDFMYEQPMDVTKFKCYEFIESHVGKDYFNFFTCDAEGKSWKDRSIEINIVLSVLQGCFYLRISEGIIKTYGGDSNWYSLIMNLALSFYQECRILRSLMSYRSSSEIFISVKGLREEPNVVRHNVKSKCIEIEGKVVTFSQRILTSLDQPRVIRVSEQISHTANKLKINLLESQLGSLNKNFVTEVIGLLMKEEELLNNSRVTQRIDVYHPSESYLRLINKQHLLAKKKDLTINKRLKNTDYFISPNLKSMIFTYAIHLARYESVDIDILSSLFDGFMLYIPKRNNFVFLLTTEDSKLFPYEIVQKEISLTEKLSDLKKEAFNLFMITKHFYECIDRDPIKLRGGVI